MAVPDDVSAVDEVLATTRAVRKRLDLDRPVPDEILLECIDLAEQAPTGGNQSSRRWLIIRDPEKKQAIADVYRDIGGEFLRTTAQRLEGTGHRNEAVMSSAAHLAEHLERVPVLVIPTIWGEHDGSGKPGLFDSVLQAAWSFCLALRARGLGSAWTTMHLAREEEVAALLGVPAGVTQAVLLPVAWTVGTEFRPADRLPATSITWFDRWGLTLDEPSGGALSLADGPGTTVEVDIDAPPEAVWAHVSDINTGAAFSNEFQGATWVDDGPAVGARFVGRNELPGRGEWEAECWVTHYEPGERFGWCTRDPESPGAQWSFELQPLAGGTRLRHHVRLGPGPSGLAQLVADHPDDEAAIVRGRLDHLHDDMQRTVEGIKGLVES